MTRVVSGERETERDREEEEERETEREREFNVISFLKIKSFEITKDNFHQK